MHVRAGRDGLADAPHATRRIHARAAARRARALAERDRALPGAVPAALRDRGHARDDVRRFGARVLERAERWHAPLARSSRRSRSGRGVEPELVAALNGAHRAARARRVHAVGRCESPEGPWLAQNWDWYADAPERCLVWSAAVEGARFATMTEAGILAKVGVSTRGLAVALNILHHAGDGRGELGVPVHLVLRRLLERGRERRGRLGAARDTPYSASSCITVVDARGRRRVLRALTRRASRASSRATACSRTRTTSSTTALVRRPRPSSRRPGSRARARASRSRDARGTAETLADALALLGDHDAEPQAICRHDEPSGEPGRPLVGTVVSLAMRPPSRSCAWPQDSRASAPSSLTRSDGARRVHTWGQTRTVGVRPQVSGAAVRLRRLPDL